MDRFAALFSQLDQTTSTKAKTAALAEYFREASAPDRVWTIALLSGRRPKRTVTTTRLREWASEEAALPLWLFEASYDVVGDLAETIALVLPPASKRSERSLTEWILWLKALAKHEDADKRAEIRAAWDCLSGPQRFVFNKLITGGFRMGVSRKLMTRALAQATGIEEPILAHRLMGDWDPESTRFEDLVHAAEGSETLSRPYPFYLAYQLEQTPEQLGAPDEWCAEWKWDGIRGQLIRRDGTLFVWSRGEELMTDRFPELRVTLDHLPDGVVLDGELLAWDKADEKPLSFNALQKRIGRKTVPKKLLSEAPVVLRAYDMLEEAGRDLRQLPFAARREGLDRLMDQVPPDGGLRASPLITFETWESLAETRSTAREAGAEGIMLKRAGSPYLAGRKKGDWWKWKLDPLIIDAVMIYAQAGHGRRANLYTDFTFAVWKGEELVPFAKAYSGLTDAEFREISAWVRKNTLERFGPVRRVPKRSSV
ncbi:MAG: ATP-dependent DNA ligase, partial [Pseudomonadota bacterium]